MLLCRSPFGGGGPGDQGVIDTSVSRRNISSSPLQPKRKNSLHRTACTSIRCRMQMTGTYFRVIVGVPVQRLSSSMHIEPCAQHWEMQMMRTLAVATILAAIVMNTGTAFAASHPKRHGHDAHASTPARPATSGAEWWQNRGNADEMGLPYR
jgi:hypothetical protein